MGRVMIYNTSYARIALEIKLGRELLPNEVVHHVDGDCFNDEPENLVVMTDTEHRSLHATGRTNKGCIGQTRTKEYIEKLRLSRTGKKVSEESKEKNRLAHLGKVASEETKKKISLSSTGRTNRSNTGKVQTQEEKDRRVASRKKNSKEKFNKFFEEVMGGKIPYEA